jgi:membrane-associated HD superfamily phosphohydrolase
MKKLFFAVVLALAVVSAALAQGGGSIAQASIALLADPAVRKELKLTAAQSKQIEAEFKRVNDAMKNTKPPKTAQEQQAIQKKVQSLQSSLVSRVQGKLTGTQKKRLRELGLQFFGPFAMLSPDIQKELGLNASQVAKIKSAQASMRNEMEALQKKRQSQVAAITKPKDPKDEKAMQAYAQKVQAMLAQHGPADQKSVQAMKKRAEDRVMAALSSAQKSKWKEMLGRIFKPAGK